MILLLLPHLLIHLSSSLFLTVMPFSPFSPVLRVGARRRPSPPTSRVSPLPVRRPRPSPCGSLPVSPASGHTTLSLGEGAHRPGRVARLPSLSRGSILPLKLAGSVSREPQGFAHLGRERQCAWRGIALPMGGSLRAVASTCPDNGRLVRDGETEKEQKRREK